MTSPGVKSSCILSYRSFLSCRNLACTLHPARYGLGCSPCISKNLRLGEVPNRFFNALDPECERSGDTFADFAAQVLKTRKQNSGD